MTQQGAALQTYNNELVKCLEDLSEKREAISKEIMTEEEEKTKLENDMRIFAERLARINESLAKKIQVRNNYDRTIAETEHAYSKILESSQTLLTVLKKESQTLGHG